MGRVSKVHPPVVRSRLLLEITAELIAERGAPDQIVVEMREPGDPSVQIAFDSDDGVAGVEGVCAGKTTMAVANPSALLTLAARGVPPFRGHAPVAAVTVIPSADELVVALHGSTGLTSLEEVAERRFPLRLSLRGQRDNSVHVVTDHVLQASGLSTADIERWGGSISYDPGLPARGDRTAKAARGEIDAIIDEASATWTDDALAAGMRIVPLSERALERLTSWGYRRAWLRAERYAGLPEDVATIDFSGFPVYVRADASDELVERICAAIVERNGRITTQHGEPLPLEAMCNDGEGAPLDIPLHRAARRFWSTLGYLTEEESDE